MESADVNRESRRSATRLADFLPWPPCRQGRRFSTRTDRSTHRPPARGAPPGSGGRVRRGAAHAFHYPGERFPDAASALATPSAKPPSRKRASISNRAISSPSSAPAEDAGAGRALSSMRAANGRRAPCRARSLRTVSVDRVGRILQLDRGLSCREPMARGRRRGWFRLHLDPICIRETSPRRRPLSGRNRQAEGLLFSAAA